MQQQQDYSVKKVSPTLIVEVKKALKSINSHGSVEIYVQSGVVTQITVRNIKKTTSTNGNNGRGQRRTLEL
ncbi:MAG: hypothetical protein UX19_C0009G0003 [Candidatus Woesebacteria bacterium GW2011_GWA1_45_8]|uniref:DUF2292 domain-containing protein n=1 Tax=Candidatus Woesebacteria bacterium GW2011_GWA1_45_8 TaxID=1618559 RepID=A0A0G1Q2X1_9BACT|nr:MAG: hypothetical protein UX19_C0009G0003 [Candidatus Woesebacteria bacterium GW2011_GWA1_45_8]